MRRFCLTSSVAKYLLAYRLKHGNTDDDHEAMNAINADNLAFVKDWTDISSGSGAIPDSDPRGEAYERAYKYMEKRHTVAQLKDFIRVWNEDHQHLGLSGKKKVLIDRLLDAGFDYTTDCPTSELHDKTIQQVLHDAWFMSPRRKDDDSLNKGTENEKNIPGWLSTFLPENSHYNVAKLVEAGLVSNKDDESLATSVDGIGVLEDHDADDADPFSSILGEYKTRVKYKTRKKIQRIAQRHGKFNELDLSRQADWTKVKRLIPDAAYRQQILHHAAVWNVSQVLYVEMPLTGIALLHPWKSLQGWSSAKTKRTGRRLKSIQPG